MAVSTRINSVVYSKGIENTITQSAKRLAVVLLNESEQIIATSALMNITDGSAEGGTSAATATYLPLGFTFTANNKQLAVPTIAYTSTKSLVAASANAPAAKGFAVVSFTDVQESAEEAFEGAGKYYKFPDISNATGLGDVYETGDAVPLIVGTLSSEPIINANSNFRLTSTTITFAESSVA